MEDYFVAILKLLNVIHLENKVIVSCLLDKDKSHDVCKKMDKVFGQGACSVLKIRKYGGMKVL